MENKVPLLSIYDNSKTSRLHLKYFIQYSKVDNIIPLGHG